MANSGFLRSSAPMRPPVRSMMVAGIGAFVAITVLLYLQAALPENALLAYVEYLAHWLKQDDFYGCYFINACAEYADPAHDMHKLAAAHKKRIFEALHQRLPYISVLKRPAIDSVMTMGEGLIVTQQVSGNAAAALNATRQLAHHWTEKLLDTP